MAVEPSMLRMVRPPSKRCSGTPCYWEALARDSSERRPHWAERVGAAISGLAFAAAWNALGSGIAGSGIAAFRRSFGV
jgi:hypothetical protein